MYEEAMDSEHCARTQEFPTVVLGMRDSPNIVGGLTEALVIAANKLGEQTVRINLSIHGSDLHELAALVVAAAMQILNDVPALRYELEIVGSISSKPIQ